MHQLDIKVLNTRIIDARCNHEDYLVQYYA